MYCIPEMITNFGLEEGQQWKSDVHRTVAENVCIGRPNINTRSKLMEAVAWINSQDEDFLRTATVGNLVDAGFPAI